MIPSPCNIPRANLKNNSNILKVFVPSCLNSFNQFTNGNNHLSNTTKLFAQSSEQISSKNVYLIQVNYLKQRGLGGFMIWSLDLDDFSGTCGQGNYPLLTAINQALTGSIMYVTTMKVFAWLCYYCTISLHVCIYVRLRESNLSIKVCSQRAKANVKAKKIKDQSEEIKEKSSNIKKFFAHPISAEARMWGKRPAVMLAIYTGRGVTPEVNLRECISCTPPQSLNKAEPTLALKPRGDVTRSPKQGYQWPQKWTCVQQKFF